MSFRPIIPALLAAAAVASVAIPALTQEGESAGGDTERGRQLSYTCYGCHGIENYKNVYPTYSVPKLEGQHPEYLVSALQGYRNGDRSHSTMYAQAASMSDQDMQDIAAFLAGKPIQGGAGGQTGGRRPKALETCITCHGADGIGVTPMYPTLAGQHEDYIARALLDYKSGARKNPIMQGFAAQLSEQDIEELAAHYSRQKPSLSTAEHAIWFAAGE